MEKQCIDCNQLLTIQCFTVDRKNKDFLSSRCRNCKNIFGKIWRVANLDKCKASNKKYYQKNIDRLRKDGCVRARSRSKDLDHKAKRKEQRRKRWETDPQAHYVSYRSNAKIRKIEFTLSKEEFLSFWQKNCNYCGVKISTVSIDRIDSSQGYYKNNCTSSCLQCNLAKLDYSKEDFFSWIERVYKFNLIGKV